VPGVLKGFERRDFTHDGRARPVWWGGAGPGVVVIHEIPGITPRVAEFAERLVDAGMSVALPELVGTPGRPPTPTYIARSLLEVCISREFHCMAERRTSPVADWLRALARALHAQAGGPGVGAVGMCFSGGFSLAMAVDESVVAPVMSQPSMPFAVGRSRKADLGLDQADLERVRDRTATGACAAIGLRFTHDATVPPERFEALRRELGAGFIAVEIDSSPGNSHGIPRRAHSVLTEELVDEEGHPTRAALDQVIAFLRERLM
jgi:dienelactone hydrolase